MKDTAVIWFRSDLRIHDNEAIHKARSLCESVLPVYIFDERTFHGETSFGFRKTDKFRAQFLIDSINDLRNSLKKVGLDLLVRIGKPEDEIFNICQEVKTSWVFANRERTDEEVKVQDKLERNLWSIGQELIYTRGKMLYYTSDLPFPIAQTPDIFTNFRKEVEKYIPVRNPLPTLRHGELRLLDSNFDFGDIPTLKQLGYKNQDIEIKFKGGESEALKQLKYYLWESDLIQTYKETRNELLGWDFSSKLSPYIAHGCISPKLIFHEVKRYEKERVKNNSTYWLIFELLWRDFFRLIGKKFENKIFQLGGIGDEQDRSWSTDRTLFKIWAEGRTGIPFIDANMRELNQTGFMSNRGRQNVASFLVHDLNINWLMGAEYFESSLVDYDPCSNYGNWMYIAGVGNDPRENRYFNVVSQGRRYDPKGEYIKYWIPELNHLQEPVVHFPMQYEKDIDLVLGRDYPKPILHNKHWLN